MTQCEINIDVTIAAYYLIFLKCFGSDLSFLYYDNTKLKMKFIVNLFLKFN